MRWQGRYVNTGATVTLGGLGGGRVRLDILNSGVVRVSNLRDTTTALMTNVAAGSIPGWATDCDIVLTIDLPGLACDVWIDGVQTLNHTVAANTGSFETARRLGLLAYDDGSGVPPNTAQVQGTFSRLDIWKAYTATGDTSGLGAPFKTITGGAAAVNADAWKLLIDAT
jgi:hypothetical protein